MRRARWPDAPFRKTWPIKAAEPWRMPAWVPVVVGAAIGAALMVLLLYMGYRDLSGMWGRLWR
jgi:hypothetical protein